MRNPALPLHVDNLASIKDMEADGWKGQDASLDESLFEYGLAWRQITNEEGKPEIAFVYSIGNGRFDRCSMPANLDPQKEWDWIKWESVANAYGTSVEDLLHSDLGLANLVSVLVGYYGRLEIFGDSYWEGFEIKP
jgi:hypothetical protein